MSSRTAPDLFHHAGGQLRDDIMQIVNIHQKRTRTLRNTSTQSPNVSDEWSGLRLLVMTLVCGLKTTTLYLKTSCQQQSCYCCADIVTPTHAHPNGLLSVPSVLGGRSLQLPTTRERKLHMLRYALFRPISAS